MYLYLLYVVFFLIFVFYILFYLILYFSKFLLIKIWGISLVVVSCFKCARVKVCCIEDGLDVGVWYVVIFLIKGLLFYV